MLVRFVMFDETRLIMKRICIPKAVRMRTP